MLGPLRRTKEAALSLDDIRALTFDTGGTVLDWHTGFTGAFRAAGDKHGIERDWPAITNDLRRRSLGAMLNLGANEPPAYNFDGAHRAVVEELVTEHGLGAFSDDDIHAIAYTAPHSFKCWPDFPATQPRLRERYTVASFTILSFRIIIDTARVNGLSWDAVFSCEAIGKYKPLPEAYRSVAQFLQLEPAQCLMVACHDFDLNAAQAVGYKTAMVRRAGEWGVEGPPPRQPGGRPHDITVDTFPELAAALGVPL